MNKRLNVQEVAIAIAAKKLNPTVLNPDFLKYSDIIPTDWELTRPPVYTNGLAQLLFDNGIGIVAQSNRIVFAEAIGSKDLSTVKVADIACRCIEKLSKVEYQAVGINVTGSAICESEEEAYQYLCQTLLSPGNWQEFGEGRMQAGIQLAYALKRGQLTLGINQAVLKSTEQSIPAILFAGNFNYPVVGNTSLEQLTDLQQVILNWQSDVAVYRQLIEQKFLQVATETQTELPMVVNL